MLQRPDNGPLDDLQVRLLELLADPVNASLSNREIGRRVEVDHKYIAGFRAALAATGWAPAGYGTSGKPPSGTQSMPGHTVAGEPPALNSWDCWVMASQREKMKFVDAVGMHHLLNAAPPDHREAFLQQVCRIPGSPAPKYPPLALPPDLSIPDFLRRGGGAA